MLARAVLEGVAHAMRDRLALLRRAGAPVDELRVSGGDTRLATWNRIKADVIGVPVIPVSGDAAAAGVAMLAGIGSGAYRDPADAIRQAVRLGPPIDPDPAVAARHAERHEAWRRLRADEQVRRAGPDEPA